MAKNKSSAWTDNKPLCSPRGSLRGLLAPPGQDGRTQFPTLGWGWGLPRMSSSFMPQVGLQCHHCQPLQTGTPGVQTGLMF